MNISLHFLTSKLQLREVKRSLLLSMTMIYLPLRRKALDELNTICEQQFQVSAQDVLTRTPQANLITKPSSQQRQSEKRKLVREAKKAIQQSLSDENTAPPAKRTHASPLNLTKSAEEDLLEKAQAWGENEVVNWSKLARDYGITTSNGGQSIKEFLSGHKIPAAAQEQRTLRSLRRRRKKLPSFSDAKELHYFNKKAAFLSGSIW